MVVLHLKFIFASDSFKGSLSSNEICQILTRTAKRYFSEAETVSVPVADGGEGTVDALLTSVGGQKRSTTVMGPLMIPVRAEWGILSSGAAVIEMAQASGITLVEPKRRDPRYTTSFGTGELIAEALRHGVRQILIGIGGSATNDGGMGMLAALGAVFTDAEGCVLPPIGASLAKVNNVNLSGLMPELRDAEITVICDVTNPLLGANGATYIYGPQKGADAAICCELEEGMKHYSAILSRTVKKDISGFSGAGAAGGLGAALGGVLGATMSRGISKVLDMADFDNKLEKANLVITGEGRMDSQSIHYGKAPAEVAIHCAKRGIPVAAIVGSVAEDAEEYYDICEGVILPTAPGPISLDDALANAPSLYEAAAERLFRAIRIGINIAEKK